VTFYALLTVDNAQSHVTAFRPISEAARSWSDDNVTCHMFAETTHIVAAPHGFACVVIPATWLVSSKFVQGFWSHGGTKFALSHYFGYWLSKQLVPYKP